MSSSGLSRRRVANASPSTTVSDDTPSSSAHSGDGHPIAGAPSHAGSAFEGGSKIAFDPRDLENDDEDGRQGGRMPRLTIMEEVLLLGIKDKQVSQS
jgi:Golgi phosphoprotein 3